MLSEVLLRRKNKLNLPPGSGSEEETKVLLYSMLRNFEALGYSLSEDVIRVLLEYSEQELENLYFELLPMLKKLKGADVVYKPMYKGFPQEVAEKSKAELFLNAIIHYLTNGHWMPGSEEKVRLPLYETTAETKLTLGTEEDLTEIAKNLISSKTSLSDQDKEDINNIIRTEGIRKVRPDQIPMKENLVYFSFLMMQELSLEEAARELGVLYQTATDVLRLMAAMSEGDISLAEPTHYNRMPRARRRLIMDLLAGIKNPLEDMFRHRNKWIRAGEILHPGEYKNEKYDMVRESFRKIRNNEKPLFFGGQVEQMLLSGDTLGAAKLLSKRPGEFVRRLDVLLRRASRTQQQEEILQLFAETAEKVSVPVLLQTMAHFDARTSDDDIRVFFPKGSLAKVIGIPNLLPLLDPMICRRTAGICRELIRRQFAAKPPMGKVYISKDMAYFAVPFSQRSASSGNRLLVRGSQIPLKDNVKVVRGFIHWTNLDDDPHTDDGRVDIDLSASFYDQNWDYVTHISYTNLAESDLGAYHSGDIVNGGPLSGDGKAEFIDLDIETTAKQARYVVFQVYTFTEQTFKTLPNIRFGWMQREKPKSGEIFEPKTVDSVFDLSADSTVAIPVIFDCQERKFIWCDVIKCGRDHYFGNNLESNFHGVTALGYAMTHLRKPTLDELIRLHVQARGEIVDQRDEADIIFDTNTAVPEMLVQKAKEDGTVELEIVERKDVPIITPFDLDYYMGQML